MADRKRRVYIVHRTHEPTEQEILSNYSKVLDAIDTDLSYKALATRIQRAKKRTGERLIRIRDKNGDPITIEIRDVD